MVSYQGNAPIANNLYGVANGTNSSSPLITVFNTRDPNSNDFNYQVKQRWVNTSQNSEWILIGFTQSNNTTVANWIQLSDRVFTLNVIYQNTPGSYTYTPTSGMQYCKVEVIGGGGGGGGAAATTTGQSCGGGGGAGAYGTGIFSSAAIAASKPYVVGAGGTAGDNTGGNGGPGAPSSFGTTLIVCSGGIGGIGSTGDTNIGSLVGSAGGSPSGTGLAYGNNGWPGASSSWANLTPASGFYAISGAGGNSIYGTGGQQNSTQGVVAADGRPGMVGGGGSGAFTSGVAGNQTGGTGGAGVVIITEYIFI